MANVSINLSQNAANNGAISAGVTTLSDRVDPLLTLGYMIDSHYYYYSTYSIAGTTARFNYSNGASLTINGGVLANPSAASGTATATSQVFYYPNDFQFAVGGDLHYSYTSASTGPNFTLTGGTLSSVNARSLYSTGSQYYDQTYGNYSNTLSGSIILTGAENISGTITSMTGLYEKDLRSSFYEGSFTVSANISSVGAGLSSADVSGTLSAKQLSWYDGSSVSLSNLAISCTDSTNVSTVSLLGNAANFSGNDIFSIVLPTSISTPLVIAAGSGDDQIALTGGGGKLSVDAGSGNDQITLVDMLHRVDGGSGFDIAAFSSNRSNYTITKTGSGFTVSASAGTDGTDTVTNVEYLQFADKAITISPENSFDAYTALLYQGALGRTPDPGGLAGWISFTTALPAETKAMGVYGLSDAPGNYNGNLSIAAGFTNSPEFVVKYGSLNNTQFVTQLYANILDRAPDEAGLNGWLKFLTEGASQEKLLVGFALSQEAIANATVGYVGIHGQHDAWLMLS